jgi:hypothetical protein
MWPRTGGTVNALKIEIALMSGAQKTQGCIILVGISSSEKFQHIVIAQGRELSV